VPFPFLPELPEPEYLALKASISAIYGYDVDRGRFGQAVGSPGRVLGAHAQ
jgi:hypothetical protein